MKQQREWGTSEYSKTIGIKPEKLDIIRLNKGKKSLAGMLDFILENYFNNLKTN